MFIVFTRIFGVAILGFIVWLFIKNSKWFDKKVDGVVDTPNFNEPETREVIEKIESTKNALGERSKERKDQATALNVEAEKIDGYLHKNKTAVNKVVVEKEEKPME